MRRTRRLIVVTSIGVALLTGACGVDTDRSPRDVTPAERPTDADPATGGSARPGTGSIVYFLGPEGPGENAPLTPVGRAGRADATGLLEALLEGPTSVEQDVEGLRTAIPAGTRLLSGALDGQGTLQVDVSSELLTSAGDVLLDAVAQIVFTGSELEGVERIRLLVDGEPQDWPTSSGDSTREPLSMFDFPDRIPFTQPDYPAIPSPTVATTMTTTTVAPVTTAPPTTAPPTTPEGRPPLTRPPATTVAGPTATTDPDS